MSDVCIHLGMQKTASTSMQEHVFTELSDLNYIYKGDIRDALLKAKKGLPIFMSYENYVGYPHVNYKRNYPGYMATRKSALSALGGMFPNADTILIIREHVGLVKSLYNQFVKVGGGISFEDYVGGDAEQRLEKEALIYEDLVADIKQNFSGRLLLLDFRLLGQNIELFDNVFLEFIGSEKRGMFNVLKTKRSNDSLTMKELKAQLWFNKLIKTDFTKSGFNFGTQGFKRVRVFSKHVGSKCWSSESIFSDEALDDLAQYYQNDRKFLTKIMPDGYAVI